jgi:hypothetical protein
MKRKKQLSRIALMAEERFLSPAGQEVSREFMANKAVLATQRAVNQQLIQGIPPQPQPTPALGLNCYQRRNPGAGFLNSHTRFCAFDRSEGIDHGLASKHLLVGGWCGNVCDACAGAQEGNGVKKTPKYRPEQIGSEIFLAELVAGPRLPRPISPNPKPQTAEAPEAEAETEENESIMATKKGSKKTAAAKNGDGNKSITDKRALQLLAQADEAEVSKSAQTRARWIRAKCYQMSVNRGVRVEAERA